MARLDQLPFFVQVLALSAAAMLVPMAHAIRIEDFFTARVFLHSGLLIFLLTVLIAVATSNRPALPSLRGQLIGLFSAFMVLPAVLGVPLIYLNLSLSLTDIYFEMLSCLTTTGATVFGVESAANEPTHLWRGLVGWLGGLMMIVSALAIFAPMNLGGFEVYAKAKTGSQSPGLARIRTADAGMRMASFARRLAPIYLALTLVLAFALVMTGERPFVAAMLAMATLSTSGITSFGPAGVMDANPLGEVLIFVFLLPAVSRIWIAAERTLPKIRDLLVDHEFRLMLAFVVILPAFLFLRHWFAALDTGGPLDIKAAVSAAWGSVFTVLSFLTTTGFVSASWHDSEVWSGLQSSGIILLGLAVMGGGVATTAGGIKLLRVYALYKHGSRELQKLSYPSSVGGAGGDARHIRREGAYLAWMFFMLFAITTALVMLALSLNGLGFEESLAYGTAALSTTGPLAAAVLENGGSYDGLSTPAKLILCAAMVLGRLETLAIIAILNPEFWRR